MSILMHEHTGKVERARLWAVQCFLYCLVQIIEKLIVAGVVLVILATFSFQWLAYMRINPLLETVLALFVVPFVVNVSLLLQGHRLVPLIVIIACVFLLLTFKKGYMVLDCR